MEATGILGDQSLIRHMGGEERKEFHQENGSPAKGEIPSLIRIGLTIDICGLNWMV